MRRLNNEDILSFIETQLSVWPLAKSNYDALTRVTRRNIRLGDLVCGIQYNPARIVSTGAKTDSVSVKNRKCFLCKENRPVEQLTLDNVPGWDILVNPFPILPVHFTIVSKTHAPQSDVPEDIVQFAELLPGMAVFFNGANAGASAPDHLHLQAVLKDELPLLRLVEKFHTSNLSQFISSDSLNLDLPFQFFSGIVSDDSDCEKVLKAAFVIGGLGADEKLNNPYLKNVFFWIDNFGRLRFIVIPRRAHRPSCYGMEGENSRLISPGCIDMTGLVITPLKKDFDSLSKEELKNIFSDVALK